MDSDDRVLSLDLDDNVGLDVEECGDEITPKSKTRKVVTGKEFGTHGQRLSATGTSDTMAQAILGRMAELADAQDLKSWAP